MVDTGFSKEEIKRAESEARWIGLEGLWGVFRSGGLIERGGADLPFLAVD